MRADTLAEQLDEVVRGMDLHDATLRRLLGVSADTLAAWRSGTATPSAAESDRIALARSILAAFPVEPARLRQAIEAQVEGQAPIDAVARRAHPAIIQSRLARALDMAPVPGMITWDEGLTPLPIAEPVGYVDVRTGQRRTTR